MSANVTRYSHVDAPDEYSLTFRQRKLRARPEARHPRNILVRSESFRFKRTRGRGRRITIQGSRVEVADTRGDEEITHNIGLRSDSLGLATLPRLSPEEGGDEIARIADMFATFRVFDLNIAEARKPSRVDGGPLRDDGSNLASFLLGLREDDSLFSDLLSDARAMIPGLISIDFEDVGGSSEATAIKLVEEGLSDSTDLADASLGAIRVLALLALLYDPAPPLLTCVEEIDHGLHPHVFDRLVERMREAAQRTQLLVVTHSPALVNRLRPEELIVCERGPDGSSRIPAIG